MVDQLIVLFWSLTSFAVLTGSLLHLFAPANNEILKDILLYGKTKLNNVKPSSLSRYFNIPKSCFRHFYIVGTIVNVFALFISTSQYICGRTSAIPRILYPFLSSGAPSTDAASVIVVLALYVAQNVRRLCECVWVSVYNQHGQMNLAHYAMGIVLYATFPVAIWSQAPVLQPQIGGATEFVQVRFVPGILLFCWASIQQHKCHVTLAGLRKNKNGEVWSYGHFLPRGGWFDYITCPHFFMEILIYTALLLIIGYQHLPMWSIYLFVFSNQVMAAMFSYDWYKRNYTKRADRKFLSQVKAIFPMVL